MASSFAAPPPVLGGCRVVSWARVGRSIPFSGTSGIFVDGQEVGRVPRLVIGRRLGESEILLLHCNRNWSALAASAHTTVDEAKERAEQIYPGIGTAWVDEEVTEEQALAYIEKVTSGSKCSFCGRRPDQVQRIIARGKARICDICIREFAKEDVVN